MRTYLIAYDPAKGRPTRRDRTGYLVRTAALTELLLAGRLTDEDGRAALAPRGSGTEDDDPVLAAVLAQVARSGPKRWKHWVRKDARRTATAVRDGLAAAGVLRVERRRVLGLVPADRVHLRDHRAAKDLTAAAARAITGSAPVAHLPAEEAALAAIAANGELNTVCSGSARREHRARIAQLVERSGPAVPALKKVISDDAAAAGAA